jgi:glucan phosphoethanolaminetransferase (alkaline phosphatase superfamily)
MRKLILAIIAIAVVLLTGVQLPIFRTEITIPADKISQGGGFAYLFKADDYNGRFLHFPVDSVRSGSASNLSAFEDGKLLGPPHEPHETIRNKGLGAFSHWHGMLVFSTSDNSDPRTNGRTYKISGGMQISEPLRSWALISLVIPFAGILFLGRRTLASSLKKALTRESLLPLAKVAAVAALFFISWRPLLAEATTDTWLFTISGEWHSLWLSGKTLISIGFVLTLVATIAGTCVIPFIGQSKIRLPLALLLIIAFLSDAIVLNITGQNLTLDMVDTLWRERNVDADTFVGYLGPIVQFGALSAALFAVLACPPNWAVGRRFAVIPLVALIAPFAILYETHGATTASPPGISVPAQLAFVNVAGARVSELREPVDYADRPKPLIKKIVFIVDESVRGDFLSLNNSILDNTPSLVALRGDMANFGTSVSGANCSASARLFMRIGIKPSELPDITQAWSRKSTFWQYAKLAGYKTVLIDAHSPPAPLFHSYMDLSEAKSIDEIRQAKDEPSYNRDLKIPAILVDLLSRDEPMFIAVNKWGVHPHFIDRMPPNFHYATEKSPKDPKLTGARGEVVSQYDRSLKWSVDQFFELLGQKIVREDTLVFYTSDHGQALFDGGYESQHCSLGYRIANSEAYVPLFAITGDKDLLRVLDAAAQRFHNLTSHFEIFPTLLYAMGYSREWLNQRYGPTLLEVPEERDRGFLMGTFYQPGAKWLTLGRDGFATRPTN